MVVVESGLVEVTCGTCGGDFVLVSVGSVVCLDLDGFAVVVVGASVGVDLCTDVVVVGVVDVSGRGKIGENSGRGILCIL